MARIIPAGFFFSLALCFASVAQAAPRLDASLWARASIPGVDNVAVYGRFTNPGTQPVVIVSVHSNIAKSAMIHKTVISNGMVSMEPMHRLQVAPGETFECKPGKCHIMLMGLEQPLKQGEDFKLGLAFEDGSSMDVTVKVGSIDQMKAP